MEALAFILFSVTGFFVLFLYLSLRFLWDFEVSERERERKKCEEWFAVRRSALKCWHYIDLDAEDGTEYCPRCLELMSKQCAFCGRLISIGDLVGICAPKSIAELPQFGTEPYSSAPLEFVTCQRPDCAKKVKPAGVWSPPGRIQKETI
ncbi:MAG: hypothetical protein HY813_00090 [Candidatus Portnoybacteria bacterium]|nr:hypothetical protein [Candidatus Portnoybacteria bacterium]